MGWISRLYGTTVGLETAPLIYFVERHPKYLPLVYPFFEAVQRSDIQVITSTLTLTEVLVHPFKRGDQSLVKKYSRIFAEYPESDDVSRFSGDRHRSRSPSSRIWIEDAGFHSTRNGENWRCNKLFLE